MRPCKERTEWLGGQGRGPEAESLLKLLRQCGYGNPTFQRLLARALLRLRKKLLFEASKVGLSAYGRERIELPEFLTRWVWNSL